MADSLSPPQKESGDQWNRRSPRLHKGCLPLANKDRASLNANANDGEANEDQASASTSTSGGLVNKDHTNEAEGPLAVPQPKEPTAEEKEADPKEASRSHGILYEAAREFGDEAEDEAPPPNSCNAHLFIFSQKQEEEEEEKEASRILKQLMEATNQDLVSVTKALLRTSGDVSLAAELLARTASASSTSPGPAPSCSSPPGPAPRLWRRHDDEQLLSGEASLRQQLLSTFGEEGVARRMVFLDA